jgi:hypothetical protein
MTEDDHRKIVEDESDGRILIGVDTHVARRIFTDSTYAQFRKDIGESLYLERFVAQASMALSFLLALLALILTPRAMGWWAILGLPASLTAFLLYQSESGRSGKGMFSALLIAVTAISLYLFSTWNSSMKLWLLSLAGALFFSRLLYRSSVFFLRSLVVRNWRALAILRDKGVIIREASEVSMR